MQAHLLYVFILTFKVQWAHIYVAYTYITRDLSGMGAVKTVLKATIFFLIYVKNRGFAQSSFQNQKYFKKIHDHGKVMENRFIIPDIFDFEKKYFRVYF